ncbi:MAG TPA: DUF5668 domain-containing protein [Candidatus Udaeobacter sp.]|jgi:hypothetical protein|nr:DUF5668 domain-containing protein [Candidatus Udaeobacter sp.]
MPETVQHRYTGRLLIGLVVLALGVLFTLDNLGLADAHAALRWSPVVIILYGLMKLLGLGCRRGYISGTIFILAGTWLLLHALGYVEYDIWQFWPVLLVIWGIAIIRGGGRFIGVSYRRPKGWRVVRDWDKAADVGVGVGAIGSSRKQAGEAAGGTGGAGAMGGADEGDPPHSARYSPESSMPTFSTFAFMGSVARKVTSQEFRGGDIVCVMGGGDVDLRPARMAEGVARVEVNLLMGGVNLFVPANWAVEFQGMPIMGSVEDRTQRPESAPAGRLILSGVILMSSVIIRN